MEWPGEFPEDRAFVGLQGPGVSCELDSEQPLKDTKKKHNLTAYSSEQPVKELKAKPCDSQTSSLTECLQWFNFRQHNGVRSVTMGHLELMDFFEALLQYLRSEEDGKEEVTLQLLLNVSAQCGVCFPCTSPLHRLLTAPSIPSIHTVNDDTLSEIHEVWDDIRLLLRRHLLDRLSSYSPRDPGLGQISTLWIPERVRCLQQLFFLYPQSDVLAYYQRLRAQAVLDLLSALSSSPGGDTGFDRLTAGLHSVVPALTQAFTEELSVLSRLAEPHTILSFLSTAYLSTVAQELSSLMEKECEAALRDNTSRSKIKRYSARSRATVVPVECPMKIRSFSLTSHQLWALTQLACMLLGFEKTVRDLVMNMTFVDFTEESPCLKGLLKKSREDSQTTTDAKKSTEEAGLHHTAEMHVLEFDWRSAFRGLVPHMAHCVNVVLDDACAKSLQQEEALHSAGHTSLTLSRTSAVTAGDVSSHYRENSFSTYSKRETPKVIAKFCGVIMAELDTLLPLAAACSDSSLLEVRSSFVEACGRAAFAMLDRLQERALEVPSSAPLKNLPTLLSTCIYVHQRLQHYHTKLKDSNITAANVPLTLLPIQKCQETVEALRDQLTSYSIYVCSTCILQDVESHFWANPKPFYEGERCSFSVQMWFYFLCGLRSDLWAALPADLAKEVLGQVLSETLQLLVQRYSKARPSYQRHLQLRCDITAVLLYVEDLMWSVCENPEALAHCNPYSAIAIIAGGSDWPYQIHSLCEQLLTVLIIVTAPLSLLYRTFVTDTVKDSMSQQTDSPVVHWLHAINPNLFTEEIIRDGLAGKTASACQLRLLTSDPELNPRLLLQMLLYRDCHLPRMLLENIYFCKERSSEMSTGSCRTRDDFIVALFNVFSCLNSVPKALTHVLQPYMERAQIWEYLYTLADTTHVVISCVRTLVTNSTNDLLRHVVSIVTGWQAKEPSGALFKWNVPESVLVKIPKGWNYTPLEAQGKEAINKSVICLTVQTLFFIFTNLSLLVASMPLPVRYLFLVGEKRLSQHFQQLRLVGLSLWAVLACLIQGLEDPETLEQISGLTLDRGAKESLSLLAECLRATVDVPQKGFPKSTMHKVLQTVEEKRPNWTSMQLQRARQLCSDSVFEQGGVSRVTAAELTEQKIGLMLLEVCHKAGGSDYLRQIYHIIQGNEELLMFELRESNDSPSNPSHSVNFDFGSESNVDTAGFNPLHQFDHIGKRKLDQRAVVDWTWDWPRLLPAYQGMSQVTFKTLLANRWEMQEGAELEDEEKAMVEELQKAYFVHDCSLGVQDDPSQADEMLEKETEGEM